MQESDGVVLSSSLPGTGAGVDGSEGTVTATDCPLAPPTQHAEETVDSPLSLYPSLSPAASDQFDGSISEGWSDAPSKADLVQHGGYFVLDSSDMEGDCFHDCSQLNTADPGLCAPSSFVLNGDMGLDDAKDDSPFAGLAF